MRLQKTSSTASEFRGFFIFLTVLFLILLAGTGSVLFGNYHIEEGNLLQKLREKDPDVGVITDTERHIVRKSIVSAVTTNGERLLYAIDTNFQHEYSFEEVGR